MMNRSDIVIRDSGVIFGTSGARGLVAQFSSTVCSAFTHAFVGVLRKKFQFESVMVGIDNRPSSYQMAQAICSTLVKIGIKPIYCGVLPTPALAYSAMQKNIPSIMVTGSHIPFDRNGIKFYRPDGEIDKNDEKNIVTERVEFEHILELVSLNQDSGAIEEYTQRYLSLFSKDVLKGKRIGIYEHSSAGRDIYSSLFSSLGAEVFSLERTDEFVPIDTEAVAEEDYAKARAWVKEYSLDAVFSTDGDGDRPLISDETGEWIRGDILGLLCAEALNIEALAIPVSCNTAIEKSKKFARISRTKIGSPYVIAEFETLKENYHSIAGFEANGGFILASNIEVNGQSLAALPTRDAILPALMLLTSAIDKTISQLCRELPKRYTYSDRIKNFPTELSKRIISDGLKEPEKLLSKLKINRKVSSLNSTDGLRLELEDSTIIHLRPSGNAPELRCYAESENNECSKLLVLDVLEKVQNLQSEIF
ncbi:MAG: phosphomannomutase [Psychrobium sp.]